ncbi:MAG: hypothetical protein HYW48_10610 [Deltaproteobacteria bacterium]|nr:hypothetical protein [Deltaproteobacteria bacterium]
MSQVLPFMYSFILFTICLSYTGMSIDILVKLHDKIEFLSEQDRKLMICSQQKANHLNLWEAYYYLLEQFPHQRPGLTAIRDELARRFPNPSGSCVHEQFSRIQAASKRQNREDYPGFWPNWVLGFQGGVN